MARVFLSSSPNDQPMLGQLVARLRIANHEIGFDAGQTPWETVQYQLRLSDVFIYLASPHALQNPSCQTKLTEAKKLKKKIVVVNVNPMPFPLPPMLKDYPFVDIGRGINEESLAQLVKQIGGRRGGGGTVGGTGKPVRVVNGQPVAQAQAAPRRPFSLLGCLFEGVIIALIVSAVLLASYVLLAKDQPEVAGLTDLTGNLPIPTTEVTPEVLASPVDETPIVDETPVVDETPIVESTPLEETPVVIPEITLTIELPTVETPAPQRTSVLDVVGPIAGNQDQTPLPVATTNIPDVVGPVFSGDEETPTEPPSDETPEVTPDEPSPTVFIPTDTPQPTPTFTEAPTATPTVAPTNTLPPSATPRPASPTLSPTPTLDPNRAVLAFASERTGAGDIYIMYNDGTNLIRLTDHPAVDRAPAWSPDANTIAFASERDGLSHIYLMNADGSNVRRLTTRTNLESNPAWAADGNRIAFHSQGDDGNFDIYIAELDTGVVSRLTRVAGEDLVPAWAPFGSQLLYMTNNDGNWEIYVIDADTTVFNRLTNNPAEHMFPNWGRFNNLLTFTSDRDGNREIYMMSLTIGSDVRQASISNLSRLTDNPAEDTNSVWSPDGLSIAFVSNRDGNQEVYVMTNAGSDQRNLTNNPVNDYDPAWRP